jgi:hypothetical protein
VGEVWYSTRSMSKLKILYSSGMKNTSGWDVGVLEMLGSNGDCKE